MGFNSGFKGLRNLIILSNIMRRSLYKIFFSVYEQKCVKYGNQLICLSQQRLVLLQRFYENLEQSIYFVTNACNEFHPNWKNKVLLASLNNLCLPPHRILRNSQLLKNITSSSIWKFKYLLQNIGIIRLHPLNKLWLSPKRIS